MVGNPEHLAADQSFYVNQCVFTDVPDWAKSFVGFCYTNGLVAGYGNGLYGANDPVTPAAACTVMLRFLEVSADSWSYHTACAKAVELGLTPSEALADSTITRGDMAVLMYRALGSPLGSANTVNQHFLFHWDRSVADRWQPVCPRKLEMWSAVVMVQTTPSLMSAVMMQTCSLPARWVHCLNRFVTGL